MAAAIEGCDVRRRRPLQRGERVERSLVADLADRQDGIILQRPIQLRDLRQRRQRVRGLVVAERLDDGAAEEVLPLHHQAVQRVAHALASVPYAASARVSAGRTNSDSSRGSASSSRGSDLRVGVVLEVCVGDGAQAIVGRGERLRHHVARPRIVEARTAGPATRKRT